MSWSERILCLFIELKFKVCLDVAIIYTQTRILESLHYYLIFLFFKKFEF